MLQAGGREGLVRGRVAAFWEKVRSSYWFLPGVMMVASVVLALILTGVDRAYEQELEESFVWLYGGGAEGARSLLSTVAGSVITVAGVVFSITIVVLSLASQQLGPRLLRNFMSDLGNQLVLGVFVSAFVYCVLVLRTVRAEQGDQPAFVPQVSITGAVLFALLGAIVFVYFVHHVAASVQVENAIADAGRHLKASVDELYGGRGESRHEPGLERELRDESDLPEGFYVEAKAARARRSGYVEFVDYAGLARLAAENDALIGVDVRKGQFLPLGATLARVWPSDQNGFEELEERIADLIGLSRKRVYRDLEYFVTQLVEISVRALSPSMNDAFTAMSCIDQLTDALVEVAEREPPALYHYDDQGKLRLIASGATFPALLRLSFDMIREDSRGHTAVTVRLLEVLAILAGVVRREEDRRAVYAQADMVMKGAARALAGSPELYEVAGRYREVLAAMGEETGDFA
ncbi:MAG: DUF2254 domain-containing protein [Thermoleophilia bacterium]